MYVYIYICTCLCLRPNYRLSEITFFCLKYWFFLSFIGCGGLGWGWGGVGHVRIHVKLHTLWMLRCRFGVGWGWGGVGHVRIHVKLHTLWMLRCRFGVGWGWGGVGHVPIHLKLHTLWMVVGLGWVGVGWGMFAFMWSCTRCGCYVHRNGNVSTLTAKTLRKLAWRKDAWTRLFRCSETRNHPENGAFSTIDIDTLRTFRWGETTKILSLYCKSHAINARLKTRNTAKPMVWSTQRPRCNDKIVLNAQPTIGPYRCLCVCVCSMYMYHLPVWSNLTKPPWIED